MSGMMNINVGSEVPVLLQISDGATNQFPQAEIRDKDGNVLTTLDLSHEASGLYVPSSPYLMPDEEFIKIIYIVYSDASHTTESLMYLRDCDVFMKSNIISKYNGNIWYDDGAANTNTVIGIDGTQDNPVSSFAAVNTLVQATGFRNVNIINNSTLTIGATFQNMIICGIGANITVNLNNQNIDNTEIHTAIVTGIHGGTGLILLRRAFLLNITNLNCFADDCWMTGNNTIQAGATLVFDKCRSAVAGNNTPQITFQSGATFLNFRHYSGGLQINSMEVGHVMSYETDGQFVIDASCTGGVVSLRGNMTITDNAGGAVTLTQDAALSRTQIDDELATQHGAGAWISADVSLLATELNATANKDEIIVEMNENEAKIDQVIVDISNLNNINAADVWNEDEAKRLLGLMHENISIDQPIYDSDGNLTSARVRLYSDAISVGTDVNIIATYTITAPSIGPGKFTSWKQVIN